MKKNKKHLWKYLKRSQKLTAQAIEVLRLAYKQDLEGGTASDEGAPGPMVPLPSVRDPIPHIGPVILGEELRYYQ